MKAEDLRELIKLIKKCKENDVEDYLIPPAIALDLSIRVAELTAEGKKEEAEILDKENFESIKTVMKELNYSEEEISDTLEEYRWNTFK